MINQIVAFCELISIQKLVMYVHSTPLRWWGYLICSLVLFFPILLCLDDGNRTYSESVSISTADKVLMTCIFFSLIFNIKLGRRLYFSRFVFFLSYSVAVYWLAFLVSNILWIPIDIFFFKFVGSRIPRAISDSTVEWVALIFFFYSYIKCFLITNRLGTRKSASTSIN